MSDTAITLTPKTVDMLRAEYGPITVPHDSLVDLANALLQRHIQTVKDARRVMEEHSPVPVTACD